MTVAKVNTQMFKETRFYVRNQAESETLQKAMFKLGYCWNGKSSGDTRETTYTGDAYIYVNEDCRLRHSPHTPAVVAPFASFKSAFQAPLFEAAEQHKAWKKQEYKRKQAAKAYAREASWIVHDVPSTNPWYKNMPVVEGVKVDVRYRNNAEHFGVVAGKSYADPSYWDNDGSSVDIVAYRVVKEVVEAVPEIVKTPNFPVGMVLFDCETDKAPDLTKVDKVCLRNGEIRNQVGSWGTAPMREYQVVGYTLKEVPTMIHHEENEPPKVGVPDTNPKQSIGAVALPMTMVSPLFRAMVALGKANGAGKYGLTNYIGSPVVMSTYLHAIQRHLDKIMMGEDVDAVDGVPHWGAIGANCDIIVSAQAAGTLIDDRPRADGQLEAVAALVPLVKSLAELHKDRNPKHFYMKGVV
jgi:hypothetical protein